MTLACAYVALWPLTRKYGIQQVFPTLDFAKQGEVHIFRSDSPAPLVIRDDVVVFPINDDYAFQRRYYMWLGVRIELPFHSYWDNMASFFARMDTTPGFVKRYKAESVPTAESQRAISAKSGRGKSKITPNGFEKTYPGGY
jgi:hypothetical protein